MLLCPDLPQVAHSKHNVQLVIAPLNYLFLISCKSFCPSLVVNNLHTGRPCMWPMWMQRTEMHSHHFKENESLFKHYLETGTRKLSEGGAPRAG